MALRVQFLDTVLPPACRAGILTLLDRRADEHKRFLPLSAKRQSVTSTNAQSRARCFGVSDRRAEYNQFELTVREL